MNNQKVYQIVTDQIIDLIEKNNAIPWVKPWKAGSYAQLGQSPCNHVTKTIYKGMNFILLCAMGYESPYFLTFNQVKKLKGSVKKGAKSHVVIYWKMLKIEDKKTGKEETIPMLKYYRVFNACQIEGVEFPAVETSKEFTDEFSPIDEAEKIAEGWNGQPPVNHVVGDKACYHPATDKITMPLREQFKCAEGYYSTLFYEMGHATGNEKRLNRDLSGKFGSKSYAKEELVAELTSAFLSAHCGIDNSKSIKHKAGYIKNWLTALKNDNTLIVGASSKAHKATEMILGIAEEKKKRKVA